MGKVKASISVDVETRGLHDDALDAGILFIEPGEEHMWWTTLKGENIRIDKMSTDHLKNTMAHIKRTGRLKPPYAKRFKQVYRNMQEEYFKRLSPAGEVLFGKK